MSSKAEPTPPHRSTPTVLLLACLVILSTLWYPLPQPNRPTSVSYDHRAITINGQRKILISGSIHYPRSTPEMWPDLIRKAKDGGLDVIETYVFWNGHEPSPGQYYFEERYDLVRFVKLVEEAGLYVHLRLGPYICAEWNFGGFPVWLKYVPGISFRTDNEPFKCVVHVVCVSLEQRSGGSSLSSARDVEIGERGREDEESTSIAKHLESANTMSSFIWWIVGFYWVSAGGQTLTHDAPQLYWLCIVFLAFDVFFVLFCVLLACIVGVAVCCCLPCIIAILYAVVEQEGASEEDIHQLPKYKFRRVGYPERSANEISGPCGGIMTECGSNPPIEHVVRLEDAVSSVV
ncbi:uncharacterized protein A4U43_C04F31080 [Asparagus officinalis]|uniref:beta-galactosidase n=1 Tax=Asparagus officinalis TaxID=4686 RepID=A0A5P1F9G5_ASPOF|nr:uncharacterized protein A4U43_C04F31080 [Asparagus officinalis]